MTTAKRKKLRPLLERCVGNSLRLTNINTGQQIYAFCNRQRICARCAEYYRYRVARLLDTVQWQAHVMLTMKPGEDSPTPDNIRRQSRYWHILVSSLRKRHGFFYYAWFREVARGKRLHLHVLWSIPVIEKDTLTEMARQAGFGHAGVRSIHRPGVKPQLAVINYVTKGLAKISSGHNGLWQPGTRRHQISAPVKRQGQVKRMWLAGVDGSAGIYI